MVMFTSSTPEKHARMNFSEERSRSTHTAETTLLAMIYVASKRESERDHMTLTVVMST
jgi:hypothetical protein